ncbi:hypothetical protein CRG98_049123, partial [Punica granatum]
GIRVEGWTCTGVGGHGQALVGTMTGAGGHGQGCAGDGRGWRRMTSTGVRGRRARACAGMGASALDDEHGRAG